MPVDFISSVAAQCRILTISIQEQMGGAMLSSFVIVAGQQVHCAVWGACSGRQHLGEAQRSGAIGAACGCCLFWLLPASCQFRRLP